MKRGRSSSPPGDSRTIAIAILALAGLLSQTPGRARSEQTLPTGLRLLKPTALPSGVGQVKADMLPLRPRSQGEVSRGSDHLAPDLQAIAPLDGSNVDAGQPSQSLVFALTDAGSGVNAKSIDLTLEDLSEDA